MNVRRLDIIELCGRLWYVDERLGELRAVDNPHVSIDLLDAVSLPRNGTKEDYKPLLKFPIE